MDKKDLRILFLATIFLIGSGCNSSNPTQNNSQSMVSKVKDRVVQVFERETDVVLPVDNYLATYRRFGEYFQGRFVGYHVADDIEPADLNKEVPVFAIANGVVSRVGNVSGYGGLITIKHNVEGREITALYGHLDLPNSNISLGDEVVKGQFLANLGDDQSSETDGERKHLHFGLYEGEDGRINGYERNINRISNWINPTDFFAEYGLDVDKESNKYSNLIDSSGKDIYNIDFEIPAGWDVEYIPAIRSLNLYKVSGEGSARNRSQVFVRFFDASDFLTLDTVTIHQTTDLIVGQGNYTARRYEITKKPGVANFREQPLWRNGRHIVTDFRATPGRTRYFVVAANPDLDIEVYEKLLDSMEIL